MSILSSSKLGLKCDSKQVEVSETAIASSFSAPGNILHPSLVEPDEAPVI